MRMENLGERLRSVLRWSCVGILLVCFFPAGGQGQTAKARELPDTIVVVRSAKSKDRQLAVDKAVFDARQEIVRILTGRTFEDPASARGDSTYVVILEGSRISKQAVVRAKKKSWKATVTVVFPRNKFP
jgi:hypothetical protein